MKYTFFLLFFLTAALVLAQDPDWHEVPKEDLLGNRGEIAKTLHATQDENELLKIWQRSETDEGILYLKMLSAKRLGLYGTKAAVPILVPHLDNDLDGFYARYALETIPDAEVDTALCESLQKVEKTSTLAGILTTLGVRGNSVSAAAVQPFLTHEHPEVRRAAGYAYALTSGDGGIDFFTSADIEPLFIDSGFLFAEQYEQKGNKAQAAKIYDALAAAQAKEFQKMAAIYHGALVRGLEGANWLFKQLTRESARRLFEVGLKAGRELPADESNSVARSLVGQYAFQTDSLRKAKLVRSLGDRQDDGSKSVARLLTKELAQSDDVAVREAAIDALRNVGDASAVTVLIEAANQTDAPSVAEAARETLAALPGEEVDASINALLEGDNPAIRMTAINLVAERRIFSASSVLLKALGDSNVSVSEAAASALGQVADIADLPALLRLLSEVDSEAEVQRILVVLKSACTRFSQDAAAAEVAKALEGSSTALKTQLLDLLKEIAGAKSLEIVSSFAWGDDAEMRNVATRILGEWRSPKDLDILAEACLKLAKESQEYKIRGLRGYIRLARQFDMPDDRRLSMCQEVFDLADREAERVMIFDVFARIVSVQSLDKAASYLDNAELREKAADTAVSIGEKLQGKNPRIVKAMQKVLEVSTNASVKERAQRVLEKQ